MKPPAEPRLQTTTLWYHPSQQYGGQIHGDPRYEGRTPAFVIWNLLQRYTRPGDRILDPFAGGGTTLDVAASLGRRGLGCDLAAGITAEHPATVRADARALPLADACVDFVFMDPPYSTHVEYSLDERCIGRLDAFEPEYFAALEQAFDEVARVLRDRRYLALYVSDSFRKQRGFVGIGAELYVLLRQRFVPVDHVVVVRGNRKLEKPRFHSTAAEQNFYLRGFNHLLIFKQDRAASRARGRPNSPRRG
jgi:adenine-specific DNA-methyltransferase